MSKTKLIKRKFVGKIMWHTVGIMESCMYHLGEQLHVEAGIPAHRDSSLRGALTEQEFKAIGNQIKGMRERIENFRRIAKHIERKKPSE